MKGTRILIISDIEGSTGCMDRNCARFLGRGWPRACREMTRDVDAVVTALFDAGAHQVHIQDFHRTGYNLMPGGLHPRAGLSQGYRKGPVPGMGRVKAFHGLIMLGMHAPSGSRGFLAHTLTSRISKIIVNGALISEAQLFSGALTPIPPLFFSGCPVACSHTQKFMPGVSCLALDRLRPGFSPAAWRKRLASAAVHAAAKINTRGYNPQGPFLVQVTMTRRAHAKAIEQRWLIRRRGQTLEFTVKNFNVLFKKLSQLAYLTPLKQALLPIGLPLYHLVGRAGLAWAKQKAPVFRKS